MATKTNPPNSYLISFRIFGDATHWQRRTRLQWAIESEANGCIWARTTSTVVLRSRRQAQDLLTTLVYKAELDDRDRVLLVEVTGQPSARFGLDEEDVLDNLLPQKKRQSGPDGLGGISQA
jgi:hypothetical protein